MKIPKKNKFDFLYELFVIRLKSVGGKIIKFLIRETYIIIIMY